MRTTPQVMRWYEDNDVYPGELDFDPDGMCLRICREARGLPGGVPSAVAAQVLTPVRFRVHRVRDIRMGMIGFYDDPRDDNPFGHIVTYSGRVKGADPDDLGDLLCKTNSVVANRIVTVRGDYFPRHWGDQFVFAATWLNGSAFPEFQRKPEPPRKRPVNIRNALADLRRERTRLRRLGSKESIRLANALDRDIERIKARHPKEK